MSTAQHGLAAEEIAASLYRAEGGQPLAMRWRRPEGEIDLVVGLPGGGVVFVEVKARRTRDAAAHALRPAQRRRIAAAAARWLAETGTGGDCRFDVVLIDGQGHAERIENAFDAEGG